MAALKRESPTMALVGVSVGQFSCMEMPTEAVIPNAMPRNLPKALRTTASVRNWKGMSRALFES